MAWIGGVVAACAQDGRRRKKPGKIVFLITIVSLVMGIFVPLMLILSMHGGSSMTIFPLIFIFIIMIGIIVLVAAGFTETLDQEDDNVHFNETSPRSSRDQYHTRPRNTSYYRPRGDYYWESKPSSSSFFCTNCGIQLEPEDRFCSSCGWRVN